MISCLIMYNLNFHIPMYYKNEWFQKDQYKQNETSIIIHVSVTIPAIHKWKDNPHTLRVYV